MIMELAILNVKPGQERAFETAMQEAKTIISAMTGFQGMEVRRCLEDESLYLLQVMWDTLEDHTEGFRGSPDYQRWKALLHHFYDPFPTVLHYGKPVVEA